MVVEVLTHLRTLPSGASDTDLRNAASLLPLLRASNTGLLSKVGPFISDIFLSFLPVLRFWGASLILLKTFFSIGDREISRELCFLPFLPVLRFWSASLILLRTFLSFLPRSTGIPLVLFPPTLRSAAECYSNQFASCSFLQGVVILQGLNILNFSGSAEKLRKRSHYLRKTVMLFIRFKSSGSAIV